MDKYVCDLCGYVYNIEDGDPDHGVAPGTAFDAIPDSWNCPLCNECGKEKFDKVTV